MLGVCIAYKHCYNLVHLELNLGLRSLRPSGLSYINMQCFLESSVDRLWQLLPCVNWSLRLPEKSSVWYDDNVLFPAPVHLASITPSLNVSGLYLSYSPEQD